MPELVGKLAVVGAGAMATALVKSWLAAGLVSASGIVAADISAERRTAMLDIGVQAVDQAALAVSDAALVLVAVKPQQVPEVLVDIRPHLQPGVLVVSIAAGVPLRVLESTLGEGVAVVRVMPNTPCLVGASASAFSAGKHVTAAQSDLVLRLFQAVGVAYNLSEKMLDAVTGLSGSGPAYVYLVIEALSDGGVAAGLPRSTSLTLAAQTVLGAAKMVLETGQHPAVLREMVTSPAGTTATGLLALEDGALRATLTHAVMAAADRSKDLGEAAK